MPATAAIITVDDPVHGPGSIVRDTTHDVDWLRLSETFNLLPGDVVVQTGLGGFYAGFSLAKRADVEAFIGEFGISEVAQGSKDYLHAPIMTFIETMGGVVRETSGVVFGTLSGDLFHFAYEGLSFFADPDLKGVVGCCSVSDEPGVAFTLGGTFLMRAADVAAVPEPTMLPLALFGVVALLRRRRYVRESR